MLLPFDVSSWRYRLIYLSTLISYSVQVMAAQNFVFEELYCPLLEEIRLLDKTRLHFHSLSVVSNV